MKTLPTPNPTTCRTRSTVRLASRPFALTLLVLPLLAGCMTTGARHSAIQSVFAQREKLKSEYGAGRGNIVDLGRARQLLAGLQGIDVRRCPPAFRSAWFDYLVEIEELDAKSARLAGVARLALGDKAAPADLQSLFKLAEKSPTVAQILLTGMDRVDDAWAKVERVAMDYGVMAER
jgi:hypothetical protein